MKPEWSAIDKPEDCSDYLKVTSSESNHLILTKSGQLFCQGENLRLYIDSEIDKNEQVKEFVNCTDVFPLEDSDKIIDMAAC